MRYLHVHTSTQVMELKHNDRVLFAYLISTARNGLGEKEGSFQTPRGWHRVNSKIGAAADQHAVFVSREATGEIYTPALAQVDLNRDWILGRVFCLEGLEQGVNRGGEVDSLARYIYIHGTADVASLGEPSSRGCIRMAPVDITCLFDHIDVHCKVLIE